MEAPSLRAATATAPGKLILVGEHAVVHGERAVAMPMAGLAATAAIAPEAGRLTLASPLYGGPIDDPAAVPAAVRGLAEVAIAALARLGAPAAELRLTLSSTIPIGSGLGSSAAIAVALVRALYAAFGRAPGADELLALADRAEAHAHGNPSGLDVRTVAAPGPIAFRRGEAPVPLAVAAPMTWVVADTGDRSDTRQAVAAVAARLAADGAARDRLARLGALSERVSRALAAGDARALGASLDQAHGALSALGVSSVGLDRLVEAARGAGALGAKLTGAGRGGCMLALAPEASAAADIEAALRRAGARAVWQLMLPAQESGETGV